MRETPNREEIRALVRQVLREALPAEGGPGGKEGQRLADRLRRGAGAGGTIEVRIEKDGDLSYLAWSVAEAAGNAELAAALANGKLKLRLAGGGNGAAAAAPRAAESEIRVDKGVVNESRVAEIAKRHSRLVLGPGAVLTPLGKDRAREAKLEIVRRKP